MNLRLQIEESIGATLVFCAYVITANIGLAINSVTHYASAVWPPTGIAIAAVVIGGKKMAIPIGLAAYVVNFQIDHSVIVATSIASGNSLEAITGAWMVSQLKTFDWRFNNAKQTINFATTVVLVSTLISCTIGTSILLLNGITENHNILNTFFTWWLGDILGALIILPLIMMLKEQSFSQLLPAKLTEFTILIVVVTLTCLFLFFDLGPLRGLSNLGLRRVHFLYPFIIWAALRFGPFGSTLISTLIGIFVSLGAKAAISLFTSDSSSENLFAAQAFLGISSFTGLILASTTLQNKTSELKFRSMFDIAGVPMAQIDLDGSFQLVNDQFCQLTGYSRHELLKMKFRDITFPEDVIPNDEALKRLISGLDQSLHFEKRYVRKDGSIIWVVVDSTLLRQLHTKKSSAIIGVFNDITKRKLAEQQADDSYLIAKSANQAKSAFLAAMSHEIRTPLGAIIGFTELLMSDQHLPKNTRHQFIETAHRNAIELAELIDDILDLSKIEAGRMEISHETLDLPEMINSIRDTFRSAIKASGLTMRIIIDDNVPRQIKTDKKRLRQILINIIGNAIKYTSKGSITIKVSPYKDSTNGQLLVGIYVEDTGCGIDEHEVENLFKPFSRLERVAKRNIRGTGLGLELSKRLANLLGGDIRLVKSKIDVGSTFLITVAAGVDFLEINHSKEMITPSTNEKPGAGITARLDGIHVLIAEDTPDQALLIKLFLTGAGAHVEIAENGFICIEKALANNFDIILMDMQMPILSGYEATKILRKRGFRKPIIALTAQALKGDKELCLDAGCASHLTKPFTQEALVNQILRSLDENRKTTKLPEQIDLN